MPVSAKQILIIDEHGFSRICSAFLEEVVGYETDIVSDVGELPDKLNNGDLKLIVTSYPYSASVLDVIRKRRIPTIILSDNIDGRLAAMLDDFHDSFCMIKPIDYEKFKSLVRRMVVGTSPSDASGGFPVVS